MFIKSKYDHARYLRKQAERIMNRSKDVLYSLSKIDKAYIAGLIDGDGSIHMTRKTKTGTFYTFVTIGMCDKDVIEWLAEKFGNKAIEVIYKPKESFNKEPRPIYYIRLQGRRACLLCELLHPHLKVKKKHAEVLMEYPCDARIGPRKKIRGSKINDIRIILKERLTELNKNYYERRHPKR